MHTMLMVGSLALSSKHYRTLKNSCGMIRFFGLRWLIKHGRKWFQTLKDTQEFTRMISLLGSVG